MSAQQAVRTAVVIERGADRDAVEAALPNEPMIEVVGVVEGLDESRSMLDKTPVDVLMVACADESQPAVEYIEHAVRDRPQRPVIVLGEGTSNGFVARVLEAGADDIVMLAGLRDQGTQDLLSPQARAQMAQEVSAEITFALQKALGRRHRAVQVTGTTQARMICVLGPKGGVGKTLTSASLGACLAHAGRNAVIIDLDLQFGDVGLALGLAPGKTIYDLARSGGSLDPEKFGDYLVRHDSGLGVLLAPTRPDHAGMVRVEFLRELYESARAAADFVIVDTPPGFTPEVITAIDDSTDICMVGMLDSLSLKNTKLGLETLELMGYDMGNVRLVLNRADSRVGITREDVHAIVGRPPDILVPSHRDVPRSINEGEPLVLSHPRSEVTSAFRKLAGLYIEGAVPRDESAEEKPKRRGLFRRRKD